jgi:hypothetical protein
MCPHPNSHHTIIQDNLDTLAAVPRYYMKANIPRASALPVLLQWSRLLGSRPGLLENARPDVRGAVLKTGCGALLVDVLAFALLDSEPLVPILLSAICSGLKLLCTGDGNDVETAKQLVIDALPAIGETIAKLLPHLQDGSPGAGAMTELVNLVVLLSSGPKGDEHIRMLSNANVVSAISAVRNRTTDGTLQSAVKLAALALDDDADGAHVCSSLTASKAGIPMPTTIDVGPRGASDLAILAASLAPVSEETSMHADLHHAASTAQDFRELGADGIAIREQSMQSVGHARSLTRFAGPADGVSDSNALQALPVPRSKPRSADTTADIAAARSPVLIPEEQAALDAAHALVDAAYTCCNDVSVAKNEDDQSCAPAQIVGPSVSLLLTEADAGALSVPVPTPEQHASRAAADALADAARRFGTDEDARGTDAASRSVLEALHALAPSSSSYRLQLFEGLLEHDSLTEPMHAAVRPPCEPATAHVGSDQGCQLSSSGGASGASAHPGRAGNGGSVGDNARVDSGVDEGAPVVDASVLIAERHAASTAADALTYAVRRFGADEDALGTDAASKSVLEALRALAPSSSSYRLQLFEGLLEHDTLTNPMHATVRPPCEPVTAPLDPNQGGKGPRSVGASGGTANPGRAGSGGTGSGVGGSGGSSASAGGGSGSGGAGTGSSGGGGGSAGGGSGGSDRVVQSGVSNSSGDDAPYVMLSYAWGDEDPLQSRIYPLQEKVKQLYDSLRNPIEAAGYRLWMDIKDHSIIRTGAARCISEASMTAAANATVVIVCFSETYCRSRNCILELDTAAIENIPLVFVNVGNRIEHDPDSHRNDRKCIDCWSPSCINRRRPGTGEAIFLAILQRALWFSCRDLVELETSHSSVALAVVAATPERVTRSSQVMAGTSPRPPNGNERPAGIRQRIVNASAADLPTSAVAAAGAAQPCLDSIAPSASSGYASALAPRPSVIYRVVSFLRDALAFFGLFVLLYVILNRLL